MNEVDRNAKSGHTLWLIIGALSIWGLYLAIGSTGAFTPDAKLFDPRKFFIVAGCSIGFLGFWYINVWLRARQANRQDPLPPTVVRSGRPVSVASVISLTASLIAYGLWFFAYRVSEDLQVRIGVIAAIAFGVSVVAAMIGLSDPKSKSAKWAGAVAFLLFLAAIVLFIVQVQMFVQSRTAFAQTFVR